MMNLYSIKIFFLLCLFGLKISIASVPTVEGLFRNVSNPDVEGDVVRIFFSAEQKENELKDDQVQIKNHPGLLKEILEGPQNVAHFEVIFLRKNDQVSKVLQIIYNGKERKKIRSIRAISDLSSRMKQGKSIEASLFYGLLSSLGLNTSSLMVGFLKKNASDFKENQIILNREKLRLLERYKNYLQLTKGNKDLQGELESPYDPRSAEDKEKINRLKNERMYEKTDNVKLVRINKDFFWQVSLNNVDAFFSNEKQQLRKFLFKGGDSNIIFIADQYVVFNGVYEFPKLLLYKDLSDRLYHIKALNYSVITNTSSSYFPKLHSDLEQLLLDKKEGNGVKLPFLFYEQ